MESCCQSHETGAEDQGQGSDGIDGIVQQVSMIPPSGHGVQQGQGGGGVDSPAQQVSAAPFGGEAGVTPPIRTRVNNSDRSGQTTALR